MVPAFMPEWTGNELLHRPQRFVHFQDRCKEPSQEAKIYGGGPRGRRRGGKPFARLAYVETWRLS